MEPTTLYYEISLIFLKFFKSGVLCVNFYSVAVMEVWPFLLEQRMKVWVLRRFLFDAQARRSNLTKSL